MKTETDNKQDDAQNASAVRDCPDSSGSVWPWDVVGWIAKYTDQFGRERKYRVYGWYLNPNGNFKTHSAGEQESFFEDTVYSQNNKSSNAAENQQPK